MPSTSTGFVFTVTLWHLHTQKLHVGCEIKNGTMMNCYLTVSHRQCDAEYFWEIYMFGKKMITQPGWKSMDTLSSDSVWKAFGFIFSFQSQLSRHLPFLSPKQRLAEMLQRIKWRKKTPASVDPDPLWTAGNPKWGVLFSSIATSPNMRPNKLRSGVGSRKKHSESKNVNRQKTWWKRLWARDVCTAWEVLHVTKSFNKVILVQVNDWDSMKERQTCSLHTVEAASWSGPD